jgi:2-polyprenyl-6-methoxyphenol hydroxylase-like FAD-dependent oxidoreductase
MKNQVSAAKQAVVIGGSLGGLFAGLLLRWIGWDVDIYERSPHDLDRRGGGIVLQAEVLEAFRRAGVHYDTSIGVEATERVFLDRSGGLAPDRAGQVRNRLSAGGRWIRTLGPPLRTALFRDQCGNRRLRNRPGSQNRVLTITRAGFTVRRAGPASNAGRPIHVLDQIL